MRRCVRRWSLATVILLSTVAGCARTVPPPVVAPGAERFPDYLKPTLPPDLAQLARPAQQHERAWLELQSGNPRAAERTLTDLLRRTPAFFPSHAALGYVRLSQAHHAEALQSFDRALAARPGYAPALFGRAEALVELGREGEAFEAYQAVLEREPGHVIAGRRVEVLRFRAVQSDVADAQSALAANRLDEAREHYERALKASPESAFLHRDLAAVEHRLGRVERARILLDRALALDPQDARAHALRGELLEAAGESEPALAAYRRALDLDPAFPHLAARIAAIETGLEEAALPAEFKAIETSPRVTRGDVAALLARRLHPVLQAAGKGTVLITDSRRHWAQQAILLAARAGAMEVYPNHTFQPLAGMTRGDFAGMVNRVLTLLAARAPQQSLSWRDARLTFADVRSGHTLYVPISRAVSSGVMQPIEGQTFGISHPMTGAEALQSVDRLAQLAEQAGVLVGGPPGGSRR